MDSRNVYLKRQTVISIIIIVFLISSIYFVFTGFSHRKVLFLNYKENNSIHYKVYLKKNDFFEKPYLDEGKTYITSLIKYIHVDFDYNVQFDKAISGKYKYYVVATVEANKANNEVGNYWTKDYRLTDEKTVPIKIATDYKISESVDVDYNRFNNILNDFVKSVGLSNTDGVLKVFLVVDSSIKSKDIDSSINKSLMLKMPLSKMAIEASIENNAEDSVNQISKTVGDFSLPYMISAFSGLILLLISIILFMFLIRNYKKYEEVYVYENKLRRILTTYDSIIVNVKKMPDISNYNVIRVDEFEELIDAHGEVRMPINYYSEDDKNAFLLFNDNTVWCYTLKRDKKGVQKNEK